MQARVRPADRDLVDTFMHGHYDTRLATGEKDFRSSDLMWFQEELAERMTDEAGVHPSRDRPEQFCKVPGEQVTADAGAVCGNPQTLGKRMFAVTSAVPNPTDAGGR